MIFRFPDKPIEATLAFLQRIREPEWLAQAKYDGWRLQIYKHEGRIDLFTRMGNPIEKEATVPGYLRDEVNQLVARTPDNTVLDAELVGPRGHHKPHIYLFDLLAYNNGWLVNMPFVSRHEKLLLEFSETANISFAQTSLENFRGLFDAWKKDWIDSGKGLSLCEGIVLKRKTGTMELSNNKSVDSRHLYKIKFRDIRVAR